MSICHYTSTKGDSHCPPTLDHRHAYAFGYLLLMTHCAAEFPAYYDYKIIVPGKIHSVISRWTLLSVDTKLISFHQHLKE